MNEHMWALGAPQTVPIKSPAPTDKQKARRILRAMGRAGGESSTDEDSDTEGRGRGSGSSSVKLVLRTKQTHSPKTSSPKLGHVLLIERRLAIENASLESMEKFVNGKGFNAWYGPLLEKIEKSKEMIKKYEAQIAEYAL